MSDSQGVVSPFEKPAGYAILALIVVLLQWPLLLFPMGLDQGIYATSALKMLGGAALYRDTWDMKSPGIFFMYMVPMLAGAGKTWVVQCMHLFLHGLAAAALLGLGRMFMSRSFGWVAAVTFLMIGGTWGTPITNGQPDDWLLPFLLWGEIALFTAANSGRSLRGAVWLAVGAGLLMGWVLVLRSTMLFAVVLAPLIWLAHFVGTPPVVGRPAWRRLLACLGGYVGGGLIVGALTILYFVLTGSLDDMIHCQFVWVRQYATTQLGSSNLSFGWLVAFAWLSWHEFFGNDMILHWWPVWVWIGTYGWRHWHGEIPLRAMVFWGISFALSSSSILVQLKFFNYHYWCILPFIAMALAIPTIAIGRSIAWVWCLAKGSGGKRSYAYRLATVGLVAVLTLVVTKPPTMIRNLRTRQKQGIEWARGEVPMMKYYSRFDFKHLYYPYEDQLLLELIRERNRVEGPPRVFLYGFRPQLYYMLGTSGPSKFAYNLPLRAEWSPQEWRDNLEGEVMATPPDFVLVGYNDFFKWVTGNGRTSMQEMPPWLRKMLEEDFVLVWEMSHFNLYERRTPDYTPEPREPLRRRDRYHEPGAVPGEVRPVESLGYKNPSWE